MTEYVTDDEQVERIKKWWSDNGSSVVAGLVIGIGGLMGWRYWVDYKDNQAAEASVHFAQMVSNLENNQNDSAIEQAQIILDDYSSTAYSTLARLSMAKAFVESGKYDEAADQLQMIIDAPSVDTSLQMVARKRLAALKLQQGQLDQALATLSVEHPVSFSAAFEELRGDILAAQGNLDQARDAYQRARLAQPATANPQFLQQKIDDLGQPTAQG